tara:strand:+ start:9249 stop:10001 length:753 start_codon:yes stop_codon:yes gene_type:complete
MNVLLIGNGYWGKIIQTKLKKLFKLLFILDSKNDVNVYLKKHTKINCVFICTPTITHYKLVKSCIENNIKTIFCEKPFTGDYIKARELLILSKKRNVNIFIDNIFLYRNEFLNIKKSIYNKINFVWEKNELKTNSIYKDNLINTLLYHDIYLLIKITDIIKWDIIKKKITEDELYLELNNGEITVIFNYNRNLKNKKIKKIKLNNEVIDFSFPKNDPLFEIIKKIKNNRINYNDNNILTLRTLKILNNLK